MKCINLCVKKENIQGKDTLFTTYELLKIAINNTQEGGFTIDEMMKRIRILNKLEEYAPIFQIEQDKINDDYLLKHELLELEDADFLKLKELFKQVKWGVFAKFIIDLYNEIESL
jgi:hypothetical protein